MNSPNQFTLTKHQMAQLERKLHNALLQGKQEVIFNIEHKEIYILEDVRDEDYFLNYLTNVLFDKPLCWIDGQEGQKLYGWLKSAFYVLDEKMLKKNWGVK